MTFKILKVAIVRGSVVVVMVVVEGEGKEQLLVRSARLQWAEIEIEIEVYLESCWS
jgi:hypothetical protein